MKFNKLAILALLLFFASDAFGWGRLGHCTVAEIAERHLTPKAKANIERYTGGTPLSKYAVFMDEVAKTPPYDQALRGWHASIADANCKSTVAVRSEHRKSRDGVTAMEQFAKELRNRDNLSDSTVLCAIKCIIHIVGDFHCPAHVRYTDCNNSGNEKVTFYGKPKTKYHKIWDSGVISHGRKLKAGDHVKYANMLDTYSKKEIKAVQKGWAKEWFEDAARTVRPTIRTVKSGDTLDEEWVQSQLPMGEELLQKAGYRLAKALNTIFAK